MAICQLSIDSENWRNACDLEERLAKLPEVENKVFLDEIADLNNRLTDALSREKKLKDEARDLSNRLYTSIECEAALEKENQKLRDQANKRHERLRASLQRNAVENDQDEPNCFDVFKEEDKK